MFTCRITNGKSLVCDGLPYNTFGPFPTKGMAEAWWRANDPGDWEGELGVIHSPDVVPVQFTIDA